MAEIASIGKLGNVFPHMLRRNVDMCSADGPLEMPPVTFNRVRVVNTRNTLLLAVVDASKVKAVLEIVVRVPFVRT